MNRATGSVICHLSLLLLQTFCQPRGRQRCEELQADQGRLGRLEVASREVRAVGLQGSEAGG